LVLWSKEKSEDAGAISEDARVKYSIYTILTIIAMYILEPIKSSMLFSMGFNACSKMHKKMIRSLVYSP
jgi:hypothetical protein